MGERCPLIFLLNDRIEPLDVINSSAHAFFLTGTRSPFYTKASDFQPGTGVGSCGMVGGCESRAQINLSASLLRIADRVYIYRSIHFAPSSMCFLCKDSPQPEPPSRESARARRGDKRPHWAARVMAWHNAQGLIPLHVIECECKSAHPFREANENSTRGTSYTHVFLHCAFCSIIGVGHLKRDFRRRALFLSFAGMHTCKASHSARRMCTCLSLFVYFFSIDGDAYVMADSVASLILKKAGDAEKI